MSYPLVLLRLKWCSEPSVHGARGRGCEGVFVVGSAYAG